MNEVRIIEEKPQLLSVGVASRRRRFAKENRRGFSAAVVGDPKRDPRELQVRRLLLREDDLDAAVLRFAYAFRCRNAQIVFAAAGNNHIAAWHTETFER